MEHVYGSRDHNWRSFHGGLMTMGRHGHFGAQEVIVIAWKETEREREREEVVGVLTNNATWSRSYKDGHTTTLNRGDQWCFDGEMIPRVRRRD
jgi:hypothetical protein